MLARYMSSCVRQFVCSSVCHTLVLYVVSIREKERGPRLWWEGFVNEVGFEPEVKE